jgi:hypothetical protein
MATQTPDGSLQPYVVLGHALREASANRDYVALGTLLTQYLDPAAVDIVVYVRSQVGHLTFLGAYVQLWPAQPPNALSREPSVEEMAVVLREAARP